MPWWVPWLIILGEGAVIAILIAALVTRGRAAATRKFAAAKDAWHAAEQQKAAQAALEAAERETVRQIAAAIKAAEEHANHDDPDLDILGRPRK